MLDHHLEAGKRATQLSAASLSEHCSRRTAFRRPLQTEAVRGSRPHAEGLSPSHSSPSGVAVYNSKILCFYTSWIF